MGCNIVKNVKAYDLGDKYFIVRKYAESNVSPISYYWWAHTLNKKDKKTLFYNTCLGRGILAKFDSNIACYLTLDKYVGSHKEFEKTFGVKTIEEFREKYMSNGDYYFDNVMKKIRMKKTLNAVYRKFANSKIEIEVKKETKERFHKLLEKLSDLYMPAFVLDGKRNFKFFKLYRNEVVLTTKTQGGCFMYTDKLFEMDKIVIKPFYIFKKDIEELKGFLERELKQSVTIM